MSATNPIESNLEALLSQIKEESGRRAPLSRRHEHASDEILVEQILTATAEIERQATAGGLDPGAALSLVAARTLKLAEASGVAIGLVVGNEVVCRANAGNAPDVGARVEFDKGLSGECIRTGRTVRSDDTAEDARVDPAACAALNLRSAVVVPIRFAGNVIGVFEVFATEPNAFDDWAVLAITQIANFIGGVANAAQAPPLEAVPPAALEVAEPSPSTPLESAEPLLSRALRQLASKHGRVALFLIAALVTVGAASYRVRDMMRSTRAQRRADVNLSASAGLPATPPSAVLPDPAIAREDGRVPEPTISGARRRAAGRHDLRANTVGRSPSQTVAMALPPRPQITTSASGPLRSLEVPPSPPTMAVVEPGSQRDTAMAPVMDARVADPQLAAAPPTVKAKPASPSIFGLMSRKLKSLVQKDSKKSGDKPQPAAVESGTSSAGP